MIVQKPRVINRRLEDEGFPALDRGAMAAMNRARGQLRARGDIGRLGSAGQACRNGAAQSHSASKLPDLRVSEIADEFCSHALINQTDRSRVRVIEASKDWPVEQVRRSMKKG